MGVSAKIGAKDPPFEYTSVVKRCRLAPVRAVAYSPTSASFPLVLIRCSK